MKWRRKHAVGLLDGESRKEKKLLASLHLAGENGLRGEEKGDWPCLREGIKQRAEVLQLAACSPRGVGHLVSSSMEDVYLGWATSCCRMRPEALCCTSFNGEFTGMVETEELSMLHL